MIRMFKIPETYKTIKSDLLQFVLATSPTLAPAQTDNVEVIWTVSTVSAVLLVQRFLQVGTILFYKWVKNYFFILKISNK